MVGPVTQGCILPGRGFYYREGMQDCLVDIGLGFEEVPSDWLAEVSRELRKSDRFGRLRMNDRLLEKGPR